MSDDKPRSTEQDLHQVVQFRKYTFERVASQKRLAVQLVGQMPGDVQEQQEILRYVGELIRWQEKGKDDTPWDDDNK